MIGKEWIKKTSEIVKKDKKLWNGKIQYGKVWFGIVKEINALQLNFCFNRLRIVEWFISTSVGN